jgi:hypothetical protein
VSGRVSEQIGSEGKGDVAYQSREGEADAGAQLLGVAAADLQVLVDLGLWEGESRCEK